MDILYKFYENHSTLIMTTIMTLVVIVNVLDFFNRRKNKSTLAGLVDFTKASLPTNFIDKDIQTAMTVITNSKLYYKEVAKIERGFSVSTEVANTLVFNSIIKKLSNDTYKTGAIDGE